MASILTNSSLSQSLQYFGRFIKERRNLLTAIVLGGTGTIFATAGISKFILVRMSRKYIKEVQRAPDYIPKQRKAGVDFLFMRRLTFLLKLAIPSWRSAEFFHLVVLTALMLTRTILSIKIADITGKNAQYLVERRWSDTVRGILLFAAIGIPASCVNSGLKYETNMLSLRFRKRLTLQLHEEYLKGFNFYKASHLGRIDTADQRITADIDKFCDQLSNLYTTLFKPIMDIILITHRLTGVVGRVGPLVLYLYYIMAAFVKRFLMPSFGQLTATESELEGKFRAVHQRLITNAEEVAFYDGSKKERTIANKIFNNLFNHSSHIRWLQGIVGIFDNFLVKYGSSIIGYVILSLPVYFPPKSVKLDAGTTAELTMEYVRSRQLLINLAGAIGQVVVLSSKVTQLAGITSRVSEMFEMVHNLDTIGVKPFAIRDETEERRINYAPIRDETSIQWLKEWKQRGERDKELLNQSSIVAPVRKSQGGQIIVGKFIRFENVNIVSPDGKLLVEDLTFEVRQHQNVMVTGPNGSGKSSLFRILGELWPLHSGTVVKPRKEDILFVPQKPYLVQGTLRDQIIYPQSVEDMKRMNITDEDITKLLLLVDPRKNIIGEYKLDDVRDWFTIFSGGQKQRIALARLFYHRPLFAILDECTSQVNEDIETKVYETCKELGITIFTVSHRPHLKKFHDGILLFDGRAKWEWSVVDHSQEDDHR